MGEMIIAAAILGGTSLVGSMIAGKKDKGAVSMPAKPKTPTYNVPTPPAAPKVPEVNANIEKRVDETTQAELNRQGRKRMVSAGLLSEAPKTTTAGALSYDKLNKLG